MKLIGTIALISSNTTVAFNKIHMGPYIEKNDNNKTGNNKVREEKQLPDLSPLLCEEK